MPQDAYSITLMNGDRITVLFGEATSQQKPQCYALSARSWGSYLDEDEVIAREEHLVEQSLARNGGCRLWCLYRQDDHDQVFSTCKTVRRTFLMADKQGAHEILGYCVSSVSTALPYRGHGLACFMLQHVAQWLDGVGDAAVSVLYSGMPEFYERTGWMMLPNLETILSINPWLRDGLGSYADLSVRSLSNADIEKLCVQDVEALKVGAERTEPTVDTVHLTVLPIAELVKYQHAIADYMGNLWHCEAPQYRGAAYQDQAWLYWFHDFRGRCLYIQRVHNAIQAEDEGPNIVTALLLSAVREAKEWNFTSIVTWDDSPDVRTALEKLAQAGIYTKGVGEAKRTQRISVRWRHGEKKLVDTVMSNESYVWNSRS